MTTQPTHNYTRLAIAIVLAGVLVAASLLLAVGSAVTTRTTTTTVTSETIVVQTLTSTTSISTACTYTSMPQEIDCPHYFNQTFTIVVNYTGPWGASYQGYLGSSQPVESGSFYGHTDTSESVTVTGWTDSQQVSLCAEAQKLDSSSSTLVIGILPPVNVTNETSLAYGTAKICLGYMFG